MTKKSSPAAGRKRSPRKPKGQGHKRREEILAAAQRLFARHGVYAVSTRQISAAVGISQPALYAHFRSKDEISETLMVRVFEELERRQRAALSVTPLRARLRRLGLEYIRFGLENPDAYRIAFMMEGDEKPMPLPADGEPVPAPLAAGLLAYSVPRMEIERYLAELGSKTDPDLVAQSVWASLHGLVSLLLARETFPWKDRDTLIAAHVEMICAGAERM